jgi:hypothetical protein
MDRKSNLFKRIFFHKILMEIKNSNKIVFFSVVFLIVGLIAGYFGGTYLFPSHSNYKSFNRGQGFQINSSAQSEVISAFTDAQNQSEVNSYCSQNMINCFYYCRNVSPQNQYCSSLINDSSGGYFRRG